MECLYDKCRIAYEDDKYLIYSNWEYPHTHTVILDIHENKDVLVDEDNSTFSAVRKDKMIYAISYRKIVEYDLSSNNKRILFALPTNEPSLGAKMIVIGDNLLYTNTKHLYIINRFNGNLVKSIITDLEPRFQDGDMLVCTDGYYSIAQFDTNKLEFSWIDDFINGNLENVFGGPLYNGKDCYYVLTSEYCKKHEFYINALSKTDGKLLWTETIKSRVFDYVGLIDDRFYLISGDNLYLFSLDKRKLTELAKIDDMYFPMIIYDNKYIVYRSKYDKVVFYNIDFLQQVIKINLNKGWFSIRNNYLIIESADGLDVYNISKK